MTIRELLPVDKGIFATVFQPNYPEDYAAIFGHTLPQVCDTLTVLKWGERVVMDCVTPDSWQDYVNAIIALNVSQWKRAAAAMLAEYDAIKPMTREEVTTDTANDTETFTDLTTESQKAFNDTDFSPDTKGQSDTTKVRDNTRNATVTVSGLGMARNVTDAVAKEFNLRLDNWRQSVIFAIVKEITKLIY